VVERLNTLGMRDDLHDLLQRALDSAMQAHDEMSAMPAGSADLARTAHSVKGSCAMMGFVALGEICNDIEREAAEEGDVRPLLSTMKEIIASTGAELERGG
jgi:HPt (histidine-containing phosphotransfer) domain-containing protein